MPELQTSDSEGTSVRLTAAEDAGAAAGPRDAANAPLLFRVFWGRFNGRVTCTFNSSAINNQSVVVVTASEGDEGNTTSSPQRFVGAADFTVTSVAPFGGGVRFVVQVGWRSPIPLWTDIVIMPGVPRGFIRA